MWKNVRKDIGYKRETNDSLKVLEGKEIERLIF